MGSTIKSKKRVATKKNRLKAKGTMSRKSVKITNRGNGNVNVAMVKRPK